jgi:hypothetical protein
MTTTAHHAWLDPRPNQYSGHPALGIPYGLRGTRMDGRLVIINAANMDQEFHRGYGHACEYYLRTRHGAFGTKNTRGVALLASPGHSSVVPVERGKKVRKGYEDDATPHGLTAIVSSPVSSHHIGCDVKMEAAMVIVWTKTKQRCGLTLYITPTGYIRRYPDIGFPLFFGWKGCRARSVLWPATRM